jgi:hypothetical protein
MRIFTWAVAALLLLSSSSNVRADLFITEVMSTSGAPTTGNLSGRDWWELTNNGASVVNLSGYQWEDNGPTGFNGDTAIFGNFSIAPGESIVIHQGVRTGAESEFRATWSLGAGVQILFQDDFTGANPFSGLSSSGDGVNLYNALGTLIRSVTFPASTSGTSFEWSGIDGSNLALSVVGENGAYQGSYPGGGSPIGSPGFALTSVPEPSALGLLAVAGVVAGGLRRKRS